MNKKCRKAILLCKAINRDKVTDVLFKIAKKYNVGKALWISSSAKRGFKEEYVIIEIPYKNFEGGFSSYSEYDDYLIACSQKINNLDTNGLLLGHFDETGFFWTDYQFFERVL